ncbi:hypothetical protein PT2222_180137 [Paraburkholderia tropica]
MFQCMARHFYRPMTITVRFYDSHNFGLFWYMMAYCSQIFFNGIKIYFDPNFSAELCHRRFLPSYRIV